VSTLTEDARRLDEARDRGEYLRQRCVARDLLEHLALGECHALGALALGDVGDAAAHQPAVTARQPHEAHLADDLVPGAVIVCPFERRYRAIERLLDVGTGALLGRRTVGLLWRAELERPDREQPRALESEELLGVVVRVDETSRVDIQHHDGLGRVVDQQPVARRAFADRLLGFAPLGDIAQAQHEHLAPRQRRLADGHLGGKVVAAPAPRPQLARPQIECGIARGRGKALQRLRNRLAIVRELRDQEVDSLSDDLGRGVTEHALTRRVEGADHPLLVHREHDVLDVIENDLQVLGALLARLERERAGLIRHEAHGFDDSAPLAVDGQVVIVDHPQQQSDVGLRAPGPQLQLAQLRPQLRVQLRISLRQRPRVGPDERRGGAGRGFSRAGARP